jgi:hypothetical protein
VARHRWSTAATTAHASEGRDSSKSTRLRVGSARLPVRRSRRWGWLFKPAPAPLPPPGPAGAERDAHPASRSTSRAVVGIRASPTRDLARACGSARASSTRGRLAPPTWPTPWTGARSSDAVLRFTKDLDRLCHSLGRVGHPGAHLVFVVADSQLNGVPVPNSVLCPASCAGDPAHPHQAGSPASVTTGCGAIARRKA